MCIKCRWAIEEMIRSTAEVESKWECTECGEMQFKKAADPEGRLVRYGINWTAVVFYVCVAAVLIVWAMNPISK